MMQSAQPPLRSNGTTILPLTKASLKLPTKMVIKYSTPATLARAQSETSTLCFAMSNDVYVSYGRKVGNVPI